MSGLAKKVEQGAAGVVAQARTDAKQVAGDVTRAAGEATTAAYQGEQQTQGFLRRNVWALLGICVGLALVAVLALRFG